MSTFSPELRNFDAAFTVVSDRGLRVKQKEYLRSGSLPIIDQGEGIIGGYTNDLSYQVDAASPVMVFGDHTRRSKLITFPFAVGADGVKLLRALPDWSARYLWYHMHCLDLPDRGYGRHFQFLRQCKFRFVPRDEQDRIVDKLDELLSDLDAGVAALKRAKANLKRYRASILKVAVEGHLTADWRKANPPAETGEQLLARILKARREKWEEAQLKRFAEQGKAPPKNWQAKYVDPILPQKENVKNLPEGWTQVSFGCVAECLDSIRVPINKKDRASRGGSIPYYGANGQVGWIDDFLFDETLVLVVEDETFTGREKDFSYLIGGKSWVNNHAHVLRAGDSITPEFLNFGLARYPLIPLTTGTTGRRKLTQQSLMAAPFCLPSITEQLEICSRISEAMEKIEWLLAEIEKKLAVSNGLRGGILNAAFSGQL